MTWRSAFVLKLKAGGLETFWRGGCVKEMKVFSSQWGSALELILPQPSHAMDSFAELNSLSFCDEYALL